MTGSVGAEAELGSVGFTPTMWAGVGTGEERGERRENDYIGFLW